LKRPVAASPLFSEDSVHLTIRRAAIEATLATGCAYRKQAQQSKPDAGRAENRAVGCRAGFGHWALLGMKQQSDYFAFSAFVACEGFVDGIFYSGILPSAVLNWQSFPVRQF
jgi:hypothetical protein